MKRKRTNAATVAVMVNEVLLREVHNQKVKIEELSLKLRGWQDLSAEQRKLQGLLSLSVQAEREARKTANDLLRRRAVTALLKPAVPPSTAAPKPASAPALRRRFWQW